MLTKGISSRLGIIIVATLIFVSLVGIRALSDGTPEPTAGLSATSPQTSRPAFTLTTSRTITSADGQQRLLSTRQRFQRSDGIFKLVQTSYTPDGVTQRGQTLFGFIGLGVFRLDEPGRRLVFTGPQTDAGPADIEQSLREHRLFTRTESVAGLNTVVWRKPGRAEGEFTEEYRAASLGGLLIKTVSVSTRGRETVEPTSIEMGEPPQSLFNELLSYPADYSNYERRVLETERDEPEVAGLMRQLLDRMRQIRPGSGSGQ